MKCRSPNPKLHLILSHFVRGAMVRIPLKKYPWSEFPQCNRNTHNNQPAATQNWQRSRKKQIQQVLNTKLVLLNATHCKSQHHQQPRYQHHANLSRTIHHPPNKWWSGVVALHLIIAKRWWHLGNPNLDYFRHLILWYRLWWKFQCPKHLHGIHNHWDLQLAIKGSHFHTSHDHICPTKQATHARIDTR